MNAAAVAGQSSTSVNPLDSFISAANSAVQIISSANAAESTASPTTPASTSATATPAASSSAAAAHSSGLSSKNELIVIIVSIVVGLLLIGLITGCVICCCLRRRKRRRETARIHDEEVPAWRQPLNGRNNDFEEHHGAAPSMSQQPTVPLMGTAARPSTRDHPAYRPNDDPFADPIPPSPRRYAAPNSRPGLTDGMVPGAAAYLAEEKHQNRLRKSHSQSRSTSNSNLRDSYDAGVATNHPLPTSNDENRPPTPFGLMGFGNPTGRHNKHDTVDSGYGSQSNQQDPYRSIGEPYTNRHLQNIATDHPSTALYDTHNSGSPDSFGPTQRYTTPPQVPSRSPRRQSPAFAPTSEHPEYSGDSSSSGYHGRMPQHYDSHDSTDTSGSWRTSQMGGRENLPPTPPPNAPWEERQRRWSGENRERTYERSPRQSESLPRISQSGTPRRLRFSDFEEQPLNGGYREQGVGEAM
ncbi:hypothetical protein MMC25_007946 [Agyrium rufum]|nr:hypothetical protein [Agyrium rufum]